MKVFSFFSDEHQLPVYVGNLSTVSSSIVDAHMVDEAISFESTEKPISREGLAHIYGILTLETIGEIDVHVIYDVFDDNSCKFLWAQKAAQ